jgi:hypothetical protein
MSSGQIRIYFFQDTVYKFACGLLGVGRPFDSSIPPAVSETPTNPSVKYVTSFSLNPAVPLGCAGLLCYVFDARVSSIFRNIRNAG